MIGILTALSVLPSFQRPEALLAGDVRLLARASQFEDFRVSAGCLEEYLVSMVSEEVQDDKGFASAPVTFVEDWAHVSTAKNILYDDLKLVIEVG